MLGRTTRKQITADRASAPHQKGAIRLTEVTKAYGGQTVIDRLSAVYEPSMARTRATLRRMPPLSCLQGLCRASWGSSRPSASSAPALSCISVYIML